MSYVYILLADRPLAALTRHRPHFGTVDLGGRTAHIRFADPALVLVADDDGTAWRPTDTLRTLGTAAAAEAGAPIAFAMAKLGRREAEDEAARRIAATTPAPLTGETIEPDRLYRLSF